MQVGVWIQQTLAGCGYWKQTAFALQQGGFPPLVPAPAVPIAEVVGCEKPGGPLDAEIDAEAEGGEKKRLMEEESQLVPSKV